MTSYSQKSEHTCWTLGSTRKMELLPEKIAIVTGSSAGIGAEIALEFVRQGAHVTLHGRNIEKLNLVAQKCQALSKDKKKPLMIIGDITNGDVRQQLINDTVRHYGKLDVIVSNAGNFIAGRITANCDLSGFDQMIDVHARAPYHLLKLSAKHLIKSKGNFINMSSVTGTIPVIYAGSEYSTAKATINYMMKFAATELSPQGVRVNSISPGYIDTDIINIFNATAVEKVDPESLVASTPLQRSGIVTEIANVAAFLASDKASYITGANYAVDGGLANVGACIDLPKKQERQRMLN